MVNRWKWLDGAPDGTPPGLGIALLEENLRRGRILAWIIVAAEFVFLIIDLSAWSARVDASFHYGAYALMYLLMLTVSLAYALGIRRYTSGARSGMQRRRMQRNVWCYLSFVMLWGSVVTLMDQARYGQLIVFIVNIMIGTVFYTVPARALALPFGLSCGVLLAGLPWVQPSSDILVGHYVNLSFFIVLSWIGSRLMYRYYCGDLSQKLQLEAANRELEVQVEEYNLLNERLLHANAQLQEASLLDELTGIANRRSFRLFLDRIFGNLAEEGVSMLILMLDVDCFKQYNDQYGHLQGDVVLKDVAAAIERRADGRRGQVVRWGGEEFLYALLLLPEEAPSAIAGQIHGAVAELAIPHGFSVAGKTVSVSIGGATRMIRHRSDIGRCLASADEALYQAKAAGRNQWIIADQPADSGGRGSTCV